MTSDGAAPAELPGVAQSFSDAWELFRDRLWLSLAVGGLGTVGSAAATLAPIFLALFFLLFVPAWILWPVATVAALSASLWAASWAQIAVMEALLDPYNKPTWQQCYRVAWPKVARFSWVFILLTVAVAGGLCFFILPGLFLGIVLSVAPIVVVAEDAAGVSALSRSLELVRGRFWPVTGRLMLLGIAWVALGKLPLIGWLLEGFATLYLLAAITVLYRELRDLPPAPPASPWLLRVPLGLAALGLLAMAYFASITIPAAVRSAQSLMEHPPSQDKLQQALALLTTEGSSPENVNAALQLLQSGAAQPAPAGVVNSTSTVILVPTPSPAPAQNP